MESTLQDRFARLGVHVPRILLPAPETDLSKWAVIACDQFTSQPEYWSQVEHLVGGAPSTLRLVYPEIYLDEDRPDERIADIRRHMDDYLRSGKFTERDPGFIVTKRIFAHGATRTGLMLGIDLERYDYTPGSRSLVRATEETIVARLPPRVRIREQASVELPHILVLIDDPDNSVISAALSQDSELLYTTDLMMGGGQVSGFSVSGLAHTRVAAALEAVLESSDDENPFLFAMGDGNHSLATAKAVWDGIKSRVGVDHPARYALVEVVSLYDPGLTVEPIHRLIVGSQESFTDALPVLGTLRSVKSDRIASELKTNPHSVGFSTSAGAGIIDLENVADLPVAVVQGFIDSQHLENIDFIHGAETAIGLGTKPGSIALIMPDFDPAMLFPTVAHAGILPRKAFSLGEAEEKRYYLEARRIVT